MCSYCLITCKYIGHIYYIIFVLLEHLVDIYVRPRGVVITLVSHVRDVCPYYSCIQV